MARQPSTKAQENLREHLDQRGPAQGRLDKATLAKQSQVFNDRNLELFFRRQELNEQLAEMLARPAHRSGTKASAKERLARRRLEYELESVNREIVQTNLGLVHSYVKTFSRNAKPEDAEDYTHAGIVGLMKAIDSYDPNRGKFAQWAYKPIQREVFQAVRFNDHPNMTQPDWERRGTIQAAVKKIRAEHGDDYKFTPEEVAAACDKDITVEQVIRVLNAPRLESLSKPVGEDDGTTLSDLIEDDDEMNLEDSVLSKVALTALLKYGLPVLNGRELFVIVRRFGLDDEPRSRLSAVGEQLDLSREAVRQVENKAIAKLSHPMILRQLVQAPS